MNLLKSPLRRTTAVLAGAFIGMAGAVAVASPASAHHPTVEPISACANENGTWQVKWEVTNSEDDLAGAISEIETEPGGATIDGIAPGVVLPAGGSVVGVQELAAGVEVAKLKVKGHWERDGQPIDAWSEVAVKNKPYKKCVTATPTTEPTTAPTTTPPTEPTGEPTPTPTTPPTTATPTPTLTEVPEGPRPTPIVEADCTSITLGLDNPADGVEIKLDFTTSNGEVRSLVIAPGEKKAETFSATPGLKITITLTIGKKSASETITFEQPEGCQGAGGGELPLTGAAAGTIAGGAGLLLAIGGVLFFLARRRKVKFTA